MAKTSATRRLLAIAAASGKYDPAWSIGRALAAYVGFPEDDLISQHEAYIELLRLAERATDEVTKASRDDRNISLRPVSAILAQLRRVSVVHQWDEIRKVFLSNLRELEHVEILVRTTAVEEDISQATLTDILERVAEIERALLASPDIPRDLAALVLSHLDAIRRAIHLHVLAGAELLATAAANASGALATRPKAAAKWWRRAPELLYYFTGILLHCTQVAGAALDLPDLAVPPAVCRAALKAASANPSLPPLPSGDPPATQVLPSLPRLPRSDEEDTGRGAEP